MTTKIPNRLINEKSPYLLQHAHNPVDWYPWCDEAFEKAKLEDKPVFLSIGYSTCHWCHVMQHESFEDEDVADLMNDAFVNIKLDREEHPDIDAMYMSACQLVTGGGGWPLTVIMNHDKKPFFLGTYFPKESRQNRVGMLELIPRIVEIWDENRDEIMNSGEEILKNLQQGSELPFGNAPDESLIHNAFEQMQQRFDKQYGGFGNAPKFPTPHNLIFLLRYHHHTQNKNALEMAERTLKNMRAGGIFDHVGKGFHRYSTDKQWLLPHFEKMLYDQAMLMLAYTEAFAATGKVFYREVVAEIFTYVKKYLLSPAGAFYSAEDADSEGSEGKFYLWSAQELREILLEEYTLYTDFYNIYDNGNFTDPFQHMVPETNIIFRTPEQEAETATHEILKRIDECNKKLSSVREKRQHPFKDDKILLDWNGLMIAALAYAGRIVNEPAYTSTAQKAADYLLEKMKASEKGLFHRMRNGEAGIEALIEDYAFFIFGLTELYQSTFELQYLEKAIMYADKALEDFKDTESAGFYFTDKQFAKVPVSQKEIYDGAIPSANSVMISNMITLSHLTGDSGFDHEANLVLRAFSAVVAKSPASFTHYLNGLLQALHSHTEIVITGPGQHNNIKRFIREVLSQYNPYTVMLVKDTDKDTVQLSSIASFTEGMIAIDNEPTYYICKDFACNMPITRIEDALDII